MERARRELGGEGAQGVEGEQNEDNEGVRKG